MIWLAFLACAATIVFCGSKLSKYGDVIAEKTGLGGSLTGLVMLASVTSLPELVTGISSVTYANTPDIAAGVLGSCVFNLFIFAAILDAINQPLPISAKASYSHILSASFGIILLSIVVFSLTLPEYNLPLKWVGSSSFAIAVIYFFSLRIMRSYEYRQMKRNLEQMAEALKYEDISTREAALKYGANGLMVMTAAIFLPKLGEQIALATGLGEAFVGNIFIALVSSMPEVVVSVAAVRIGAVDMGIGNIFGSNIFNIFILFIDDVFFLQGPLLSSVNPVHVIPALAAILMSAVSIIGLAYKSCGKRMFWGQDSLVMMLIFIISTTLLYYHR